MAISWRHIRDSERPARDTAAALEQHLITTAATAAKDAVAENRPGWWRLNELRDRSRMAIRRFVARAGAAARTAVAHAASVGRREAERDLERRHLTVVPTLAEAQVSAQAQREVTTRINATLPHAMQAGDRLYTETLAAVHAQPATSQAHRLRVAQSVLDRLAAAGITGFRDRLGRNWRLPEYVEMLTKTVAMDAALDAHVQTLAAHGQPLVVIDGAVDCCPACAPWHGAVVSIDGSAPAGAPVAGTLADARAAGVWHPHCRCTIRHFEVGDELPEKAESDPQLYRDRQQLRALERAVRASKRRAAAALTPQAATEANAHTRRLQARIRAHVAATAVPRQRRREQIGRAL